METLDYAIFSCLVRFILPPYADKSSEHCNQLIANANGGNPDHLLRKWALYSIHYCLIQCEVKKQYKVSKGQNIWIYVKKMVTWKKTFARRWKSTNLVFFLARKFETFPRKVLQKNPFCSKKKVFFRWRIVHGEDFSSLNEPLRFWSTSYASTLVKGHYSAAIQWTSSELSFALAWIEAEGVWCPCKNGPNDEY